MPYTATTFDVCVQGFERLRSTREFIVTAYIDSDSTIEDIASQWLDDVQAVMWDDAFNYDAAESAISEFVAMLKTEHGDKRNPFGLDESDDDESEPELGEGVIAFLFVERDDLD